MEQGRSSVLSDSNKARRISNVYINPTYVSTNSIHLQVENERKNNDHLCLTEGLDYLTFRERIRNSIQLPEARPRRKKRCCCKLLDKKNQQERLFIAYVLLITLFVMTFGSIGLSIIIRTVPLKFFPDCWKLTIALACLTFLIGLYICWEDNICGASRQRPERLNIHMEQMQTFAANV